MRESRDLGFKMKHCKGEEYPWPTYKISGTNDFNLGGVFGIKNAGIAPQGTLIEGLSSVVQLSAWNYEDAAYKTDLGLYVNFPSFVAQSNARGFGGGDNGLNRSYERLETIRQFFKEAKAYLNEKSHISTNLRFEAIKGLFNGTQKLFVRANEVKQMLLAIDLAKSIGCDSDCCCCD